MEQNTYLAFKHYVTVLYIIILCVNLPGPENNYGYAFNTGYAQQRNPVNEVSQKIPLVYFYLSSIVTVMFSNKLHDLCC